jgi:putative nucleotidyltransferase with HDIG domain
MVLTAPRMTPGITHSFPDNSAIEKACSEYLGSEVWQRLRELKGVFVVGGVVRDALMARALMDLDIVALPESAAAFESALAPFQRDSIRLNDRFSTTRFFLKNRAFLDFSLAPETGIEDDLLRRDFTINAIALETRTNTLVDPAGGLADLRAKRLAVVRARNLRDDPLRILRAYRLARECDLTMTPETRSAMASARALIAEVAPERVSEELRRLLRLQGSAADLRQMADDGVLFAVFPETLPMTTAPASPIYDLTVIEHTMAALDALDAILSDASAEFGRFAASLAHFLSRDDRRYLLRASLLLHDIAKPATARQIKGAVHYYGHDTLGAQMAQEILKRLRFPNRDRDTIATLIRAHLRIGFMSAENAITPRQIYRYYHEFGDLGILLVIHARADLLGYGAQLRQHPYGQNQPEITEALLAAYFERNRILVRPPRYLTGDDLKALSIPPGPVYKFILDAAQEATALGRITSSDSARQWARDFHASTPQEGTEP